MAAIVAAVALAVLAVLAAPGDAVATDPTSVQLILFWGDGCPHCAAEKRFLNELSADYPELVINQYEVWYNAANRQLFAETAAAAGVEARAVPTTFVGDHVWVGFSDAIGAEIREVVAAAVMGRDIEPAQSLFVDVPIIGEVDLGGRSLLVSTVVIGFVDGINPCSLWVLSMLLALVLHSGSRRRVAVVGGVFLLVTSTMYGLYILGAYSALSYVGYLPWIRVLIAAIAGVLGGLQLKDALGVRGGPSLGVSPRARPGMYQRMRELAVVDRPLPGLLAATAGLAVGVSLLETPCTVGLPILWADLLRDNDVPFVGGAVLFLLYLVVFLIDELIVFVGVVWTMRALRVQEHHGRALKLISGILMVTLAAVMMARPQAMQTVSGTVVVFAVAAALSAAGVALQRSSDRLHPVTAASHRGPVHPVHPARSAHAAKGSRRRSHLR